jgi:uncharacterized protein (TIGR00251 family)
MTDPIRAQDDAVLVDVLVVPNASRSQVVGIHGSRIKVRVAGPPEKGKANKAVADLLVQATSARRGEVVSGRTHRHKTIKLWPADIETVRNALR